MPLLQLQDICLSFSEQPLLEKVCFSMQPRERIALVGRNGAGKSTLLQIMAGVSEPHSGERELDRQTVLSYLQQSVPSGNNDTVQQVVRSGLPAATEDWEADLACQPLLSQLALPATALFASLSGGAKRKVLLAKALVNKPNLLLLDEPTNHLDIAAIQWLEDFLLKLNTGLIVVSHDRQFIRRLATRIIDLDRAVLSSWQGDYDNYLQRKAESLHAEALASQRFAKKLAAEEVWIRKGIQARRTRNEGRVRALKKLRRENASQLAQIGQVQAKIQQAEKSGQLVLSASNLCFAYETSKPIVQDFNYKLLRGEKVGLLGPNGCGKSTLLKLLLGELAPHRGQLQLGSKLQIAYFDQLRQQLDEKLSVRDNVAGGSDTVKVQGKEKHVISYLKDFLFSADKANGAISKLSGGEKNRLLLAKLFTTANNFMILDEPTNDLDLETLELLEEMLVDYQGTLIVISHDRAFLNNIVSSLLVYEPATAQFNRFNGDYEQWQQQQCDTATEKKTVTRPTKAAHKHLPSKQALSYNERKELQQLPKTIEKLEQQLQQLHNTMSQKDFYQKDNHEIVRVQNEATALQQQLKQAFTRWEALEQR